MRVFKGLLPLFLLGSLVACYEIDRVRPSNIKQYIERYPQRGVIYLTYSYENPEKKFVDAFGIYRFLWNYKQTKETYYLLEMENRHSNEIVVYYTAPTVITPVDLVLSNTVFHTIMLRHNFPEQPIYIQAGEIVYLGHIYIRITNTKVGFIPTTGYTLLWEDREAVDKETFFRNFPQLSQWVWRKHIISLYPNSSIPLVPQAPSQTSPVVPQVIYVTNVVVITNTNN